MVHVYLFKKLVKVEKYIIHNFTHVNVLRENGIIEIFAKILQYVEIIKFIIL